MKVSFSSLSPKAQWALFLVGLAIGSLLLIVWLKSQHPAPANRMQPVRPPHGQKETPHLVPGSKRSGRQKSKPVPVDGGAGVSLSPELAARLAEDSKTVPQKVGSSAGSQVHPMPVLTRVAPTVDELTDSDMRALVTKAISKTETAARVIAIEDQMKDMQTSLAAVNQKLDHLLQVQNQAPSSASAGGGTSSQGADSGTGDASGKDRNAGSDGDSDKATDTGAGKKPAAPAAHTITAIDLRGGGENKSAVVFHVKGARNLKVRVVSGRHSSWSSRHNWVAVDLFNAELNGALPKPAGVVRDITEGKHKGYRRFLFSTLRGDTLKAVVHQDDDAKITVALMRNGDAKKVGASVARTHTHESRSSTQHSSRYVVRAINDNAAVIFDRTTDKMRGLKLGSRVPGMGVVERFKPEHNEVVTRGGIIGSS